MAAPEYANLHCSFCGKSAIEVKKLIAGPEIYICNECVQKCHSILNEGVVTSIKKNPDTKQVPTPSEIKQFLDQYIIGQDYAKETISVAVYNHYKRLNNPVIDDVEIDKSNLLIFGPTGSGKTFIAQTIARMLDVPFAITDATSLTQAGYIGEDVESILSRLLNAANNDIKQAERGIVFIDEIDKKSSRSSGNNSLDVSGEGVQQALLKLLEGSEVMVTVNPGSKKNPNAEMVKINTKNILFIVGGAFVGLDKIVQKSMAKNASIGFNSTINNHDETDTFELLKHVEPEHLISYGLIPELVGRLPVIAALHELSEEQLVQVLTEPKNALIKQYQGMFKVDGVELLFEHDALLSIAKIAKKRKTGGRALRSVIEGKLMKTQFNLPDLHKNGANKVIVHVASIDGDEVPTIFYNFEGGSVAN